MTFRTASATIYIGALSLVLISLVACHKKELVKIGFVGGLSGRVADLGTAGRNGVILAIEERNRSGGIKGRHVELLVEDDQQTPQVAKAAVVRLIARDIKAVIGPMTSAMSIATVPLANEEKVLMMSPTSTTTQLSGRDDFFFRITDSTKRYALSDAEFFFEQQEVTKVAVFYDLDNEAFTSSYLEDFTTPFQMKGGGISEKLPFHSGTEVSFYTLAKQALASDPGGVLIISSALDAALICQQIRKFNPDIPIIISEWAATEEFINLGGRAVEGVFAYQFFDRDSKDKKYLAFRNAYVARFDEEPGFASVAGYDAANVVLDALQQQHEGRTLKETILSIGTFNGLQEQINFDRFGDTTRESHLTVVRNGEFATLQ